MSRLKRKLERDGDDGESNLNESFVTFGTALPSLADTKKDKNEFVPVWQQTVTDDRGRRRFHGAFTGGFSAGYWNTVGSKEGWAPAQFVSSRGSRAKHEQTAQDFMDEEDLEAQRAAQTIKTNDQYDPLSGQGAVPSTSGPHESKLLNMIRPGALKIGEQLLTKMGWKPGQGVGPRLSMKARQRQARELGLVLDEDEDDAMEGEAAKHLYAPLDRPLAIYPVKENATGLGYSKQHASLQAAQAHASSSKSVREGATKMPMGGAFGISALEDADDDDLSVYDLGYRQRDTRLMELDDDDDADPYQVASRYSMKQSKAPRPGAKPPSAVESHNDGTPVIPGFKLSSASTTPETWFSAPEVPRDFRPNPKRIFDLSPLHASLPPPANEPGSRPTQLSADSRAQMLGEEAIPAPPRSVFDFMSKKNRERLLAMTGAQGSDVPSTASPASSTQALPLTVPVLDPTTAQAALKGFQPFGDDKNKQSRYRFYLQAQAGLKSDQGVFAPSAAPERLEELNRELVEFQKAAMVFRPMSFAMSSRFTSSTSEQTAKDMQAQTQAGLRFLEPAAEKRVVEDAAPDVEKEPTDPKVLAVRAGMFGRLTRTERKFYPVRLLCKRFNVMDPYPDGPALDSDEDMGPANELLSKNTMDSLREQGGIAPAADASKPKEPQVPKGVVGLGEDETQGRDTLTYEKPSMDLFRAIFAESDASDSDDEVPPPTKTAPIADLQPLNQPPSAAHFARDTAAPATEPKNALEPVSFADFKPTFIPKADRTTSTSLKKKEKRPKAALSFDVDDGDVSAPVLAPKLKKPKDKEPSKKRHKSKHAEDEVEDDDEWVEKPVAPAAAAPVRVIPARARAVDFL